MSRPDTVLAVLLRKAQWLLDEAAFEVGGGRYSNRQRRDLATALNELATALRESTGEQNSQHSQEDRPSAIVNAEQ
ncbi:hypothetical protein [Haloactinomyces albus]|uniref:Uncharacterized protein n=1 Tax=Haloactinomyces albus TaxID=1352928 RepID=A0AAE4CNP2_9ACTN|nr:hypothetical protein [Haloactinomyces albus]MDR7302247.1 hypothetical protein [Haloactinomyces albus]